MEAPRMVRVLGATQLIASDGRVTDLPSASQRRLLAVLAASPGRPIRAESLCDALELSDSALRTSISRLRRAMGDAVRSVPAGYQLDVLTDAARFSDTIAAVTGAAYVHPAARIERLEQALALWTGAPFDEFAHEDWALPEAARLNEQHAAAVDEYAAALIEALRWSDAIVVLEAHVAEHPFRDHPRGLLIHALAGAGRQSDALRAYQRYRTMLAEEVGTEPSAAVKAIEQRVAGGWDGRDTVAPQLSIPLHPILASGARLIGRRNELEAVFEELSAAHRGGLRTVLIAGEAGVGKTTFMAAVARQVAERQRRDIGHPCQLLYGRCEEEASVALQPLGAMVATLVENMPIELLADHVHRCGGELLRVAPALARRLSEDPQLSEPVPAPTSSNLETDRHRLFEAIADFLRSVTERTSLVLLLDDVQWAEPTSLLLLRHLAAELRQAPILVIVSYRDSGPPRSESLRKTFAALDRGVSRRMTLAGLTDDELRELVVATSSRPKGPDGGNVMVLGDLGRITARLQKETAGNALFASQLIRHWIDTGEIAESEPNLGAIPASLRDVVSTRVTALGMDVATVLAAAAVLGTEFKQQYVAEMVDAPHHDIDESIDAAVTAGMLQATEPTALCFRFTHALVASSLYDELPPRHRARLHERAARAYRKAADEPLPSDVLQLARHCELGGLLAEAQQWCVQAADHAFENLAPGEAAHWYEKALQHARSLSRPASECADLMVRLGHARQRAGEPDAFELLAQGAQLARESGAHAALVRAALASDRGTVRIGEYGAGQLAIVEAAMEVVGEHDPPALCQVLALYAQCLIHTPEATRRVTIAEQALELARSQDDPALLARVSSAVLNALWAPGSARRRARLASDAVVAAEDSGDPFLEFRAQATAYGIAIETADHRAARRARRRVHQLADELGEPRMRWWRGILDTFDATARADLGRAEQLVNETYRIGERIGEPDAFVIFAGQAYDIGTFGGRHEQLFPLIERTVRENPKMVVVRLAYAILCTAVGREATARAILREGQQRGFAKLPLDWTWKTAVLAYAILAIELCEADAAQELLPLVEPFTPEVSFNGISGQGPIAAYIGKLASVLGDHDKADHHLLEALAVATNFEWHYHRASTLYALGLSRSRRLGRLDAQGRAWLEEGADICSARGINGWGRRIDALLSTHE